MTKKILSRVCFWVNMCTYFFFCAEKNSSELAQKTRYRRQEFSNVINQLIFEQGFENLKHYISANYYYKIDMPTETISLMKHIPLILHCFPLGRSSVRRRNQSLVGTCAQLKLVHHTVSGHSATLADGEDCKHAKEAQCVLHFCSESQKSSVSIYL